jgi:cytochrome c-type biogenesis protein CcmH
MTLWIVLIVLCLLAILFSVWPLWKASHKLSPLVALVIVFTVGLAAGLYDSIGSPNVPSGRSGSDTNAAAMDEVLASLKARLAQNPDDIGGWMMLGRSQAALNNFAGAAEAYEKAMALESGQNSQTLVDLSLAIAQRDKQPIVGRSSELLENALVLDPHSGPALYYGGMAAANRGDTSVAADRWELLLGLNPPPEIIESLQQNIAMWRGEAMPQVAESPAPKPAVSAAEPVPVDAIISANVALSPNAVAAIRTDAVIFVIARDPAQPAPPIAVTRKRVSDLPAVVALTDANSMVAGRNLSMFNEIELLARVSLSGGPAAASGDWFGSMIVRPAETPSVSLTINQQVP